MMSNSDLPVNAQLFIDGEFRPSSDGNTFDLHSPYSGELVGMISEATSEDVDTAVAAARDAQPVWAALSPQERGKPLSKLAQMIADASFELARLDALSLGRPISTFFDAHYAITHFRYFSEAAYPVGTSSLNTQGFMNVSLRQPYGVGAAIIPWNCPLVFLSKKLAPALAAGNCMILKTSEKAPLSSHRVAQMLQEAGFPPGVVNILHGHGPQAGDAIARHMQIRALSFTGSLRTERAIQKAGKLGDPLDKETTSGPQADKSQYETVKRYIAEGKNVATTTETSTPMPTENEGLFVQPTVFLGVPENHSLAKEEVFGPVVNINTFETEEEALRIANDTEYGLYAAVFTKNIDRALRVAKGLESGMVGINCTSPTSAWDMPFGGHKQSGIGRESLLESLDDWLEKKAMFMRIGGDGSNQTGHKVLGR